MLSFFIFYFFLTTHHHSTKTIASSKVTFLNGFCWLGGGRGEQRERKCKRKVAESVGDGAGNNDGADWRRMEENRKTLGGVGGGEGRRLVTAGEQEERRLSEHGEIIKRPSGEVKTFTDLC